jgi:hypothetical protein
MIYMDNNDLQIKHLKYLVFSCPVFCKIQRLNSG